MRIYEAKISKVWDFFSFIFFFEKLKSSFKMRWEKSNKMRKVWVSKIFVSLFSGRQNFNKFEDEALLPSKIKLRAKLPAIDSLSLSFSLSAMYLLFNNGIKIFHLLPFLSFLPLSIYSVSFFFCQFFSSFSIIFKIERKRRMRKRWKKFCWCSFYHKIWWDEK